MALPLRQIRARCGGKAHRRLRPGQPPASSPASGLLDSVVTLGSGGGGGESAVAAAQDYYYLKLIHAQVTVSAPHFRGAYCGHRRNLRSNYRECVVGTLLRGLPFVAMVGFSCANINDGAEEMLVERW
ncbi:unnamed protein product [Schistocephalus solidus]|uniref:Uncharacterized protein n=1 Tax=Schistocephalus solidus TaxID=70667 RepID=A0A183T989_SCHSO|nr:unnamed protein product [Schistocephalus solidus]